MFIENIDTNLYDPKGVVSNILNFSSIKIKLLRGEKPYFLLVGETPTNRNHSKKFEVTFLTFS
jgi:hypothetical protein